MPINGEDSRGNKGTWFNGMFIPRQRICVRCGNKMYGSGKLHMKNSSSDRETYVQVYNCSRCGYRTLGE